MSRSIYPWTLEDVRIAVIGLGYVGLPLAAEFGKNIKTIGFDINVRRIAELQRGDDFTQEVSKSELGMSKNLTFTSDPEDLSAANFYIVTVPTPIDSTKRPDLSPLIAASSMLGKCISANDIVVYESTVYPGATEEVCVPLLEQGSGLVLNEDLFVGYSPERINPGDKEHRLPNITKITSGSTPEVADFIDSLYRTIIKAGTHRAPSIRVAEAAKVIENTQRDLNIALINELAIIFNKLDIDTEAVLAAAGTKWNFLNFKPGLVGGHCIGVDPYYLTHKAQEIGYLPQIILAGRRINDSMGEYVVSQVVRLMIKKRIHVANAKVLILGLAFKENCPDVRNTRVIDIVNEMNSFGASVDVYDPLVDAGAVEAEYGIKLLEELKSKPYDAIIFAVPHAEFELLGIDELRALCHENHVLYEVKHLLGADQVDGRL